jgi:hypothetical protein
MSLKPSLIESVPADTVHVARAAFPKGNLYISMRDELGVLFRDSDFAELFPQRGQPLTARQSYNKSEYKERTKKEVKKGMVEKFFRNFVRWYVKTFLWNFQSLEIFMKH